MDELELIQDYFWILETCRDPDTTLSNATEKEFATLWLLKLCNEIYPGIEAKQLRNQYLLELSKCIEGGKLSKMFHQHPPKGSSLPPFEGASNIKIDYKSIVHEMQAAATEYYPLVSPKNYQTHMSTKIFDNNQGACAYIAVSLGDPKQGPVWLQMGSKEPFSPSEDISGDDDAVNINVGFGEFCLNAIAKELCGYALANECPELETQLDKYAHFIKKYAAGEEAKTLQGNKLRNFLLLNFQTDLIRALEDYQ